MSERRPVPHFHFWLGTVRLNEEEEDETERTKEMASAGNRQCWAWRRSEHGAIIGKSPNRHGDLRVIVIRVVA